MNNNKQKCLMCLNEKALSSFYKSKSKLHANGIVPYCKVCLNSIDLLELDNLIDILQKIDIPYVKKIWDNVIEKNTTGLLGKYLKVIAIQYPDKTFKDSDLFEEQLEHLKKINKQIDNKEKKLNKIQEELNESKEIQEQERLEKEIKQKDDFDIEKMEEKWGLGFNPSDYVAFEKKFNSLKGAIPNQTKLHIEALLTYIRYQVKAEQAIAEGNADDAKKWGELAKNSAKQAKITPEQLTSADLSQGIDNFSALVREVEKAVDIIPLMPELVYTPKDKADMIIHTYINYERDLHGLPPVEYKDIYDFYNKQVENYIKEFPETYAFLKDEGVTGDTQIERVYNYIFDVVIPKKKKENPDSKFYQNLEKWVELVSYWRFYPDMWYDIISPVKKNGGKKGVRLSLDQRVNLRAMARFKHFHAVLSRGSGKCVVGDTLLFTDNGIKEIGSYFNYQNDNIETIKEQEITMLNMNGELETSPRGIYSGYKDTKKIKLKLGYEIESTLNHKLLTLNEEGNLEWKETKDLKIGDYLLVNRKNDIWGNNTLIPFDTNNFYDEKEVGSKVKKSNLPKYIDEEMALIMGYLVGDGTLTRDNIIVLSNIDKDILKNYFNFMKNKIGINVSKRSGVNCDYVIYGKYFRRYFELLGLKQCDAFNKEIPKIILNAPKKIVSAFLRGLYDTDGGVEKTSVCITTASKKLAKQMQIILLNFGIISSQTIKYNKKHKNNYYTISIYSENILKYKEFIGFSCERKQKALEKLINSKETFNTNIDIIPYQKNKIQNLIKNINDKNKKNEIYKISKWCYKTNRLTYQKLKKINEICKEIKNNQIINELKYLEETYYLYLPIEEIINDKNHVYDIYMPKTNSFIGDGIVNHNTFLNQMFFIHSAIFYPDTSLALSAQTKDNSASLISAKFKEIIKFYPILEKEYYPAPKSSIESKTNVLIKFKSGGEIDNLVNAQSSKGQRRRKLIIEESAQINNKLFIDALEPIPNVARKTIGDLTIDSPIEMHGQIHFFTTSWYRGTSEFERCLKFFDDMINLRGVFILGASYELNLLAERGESKSTILAKRDSDPIFFSLNYESKWVGAGEGALISIDKLMDLRNIETPEIERNKKTNNEYILSVDVARSVNSDNNQSSVCVLKITRKKDESIQNVSLVNIINYPSNKSFEELSIEIKKLKIKFDAKAIVVDTNGLGIGLLEYLGKEQFDVITNESLGAFKPFNEDLESAEKYAEEIIFSLKSQHINREIIINFQDYVENKKLRLLKKKDVIDNSLTYSNDEIENKVVPFVQTDLLIDEIANLKLDISENNTFKLSRLSRRIDKDRYSALVYGLYYIKKFEEQNTIQHDFDISKYFLFKK